MSSTIEAIAVGARRTGRNLTKRLHSLSMELENIITPAQQREWKSYLRECFSDPQAFKVLLEDIRQHDSQLTEAIDCTPLSFTPTSPELQSNIAKYQEYIDAFVSIFAHSIKKDFEEEDHIIYALKQRRCPKLKIFCRLLVNPNFIFHEELDSTQSQEMADSENKKVPIIQLARVCDISVLRFLCNVTEKTEPRVIVWALDYIAEMTERIGESLRNQSDSGWYGISFRKRKSTIRNSVAEVPKLALDGQPLVIGVGPAEPFINPETGQAAGPPLPSIAVSDHEDVLQESVRTMSLGPSDLPNSSLGINRPETEDRISPIPSLTELRNFGTHSPIGMSIEEMHEGAPKRRHLFDTKPPVFPEIQVQEAKTRSRRVSTGTRPTGISNPVFPKRKTSIVQPVKAVIEAIDEEVVDETDSSATVCTSYLQGRDVPPPPPDVTSQISVSNLDLPIGRQQSPLTIHVHTSPTPSPTLPPRHVDQPESRPSPSSESSSDSDESDDESPSNSGNDEPEPPVRSKLRVPSMRHSGPPPLRRYTTEHLQKELRSLITHNGRISLLGILNAISNLPSNSQLWTEGEWDACRRCILLIQFCVDFGLETLKKGDTSGAKSGFFPRQMKFRHVLHDEKPSVAYSKLVVKYSLKALIHCAISTYTGCLLEGCQVNTYYSNSRTASQNLDKMIHQLERLYSNSPLLFRETMMEFAHNGPLKRVFHFLHVLLQYCPRGSSRDPLDPSSSRRDPLIVLAASVLRIVVDRLALLNLCEPLIQHSIVKEAISFIHFAGTLFKQDFLRTKGFHHLQQYVNRVALSVLLPIPSQTPNTATTPPPLDASNVGTFPRRDKKKAAMESLDEPQKRKRGQTVTGVPGSTPDSTLSNQSPLTNRKSPRLIRRLNLVKQPSIHGDPDLLTHSSKEDNSHVLMELQKEWRGLKIGVLHQRIRRLSVMMDLTEPGAIPDPTLLASLICVGPPGSLVPRALVLLECALFVHRLNKWELSVWMKNQQTTHNWDLFYSLRKWGEAIGEALSACEITENEQFAKLSEENIDLEELKIAEEPVFGDEERDPDKRYIVNYSLKMVACILLIEITKFLREPPPIFLPPFSPTSVNRSMSTQSQERKPSNISVLSSDSDTNPSPSPSFKARQSSLEYRKCSSPLLEDIPKFLSTDHPPSPNAQSRNLSMYLRVNSRYGKHPRPLSHSTQGTTRGKHHQASLESSAETFRVASGSSPMKVNRRMSVSAAAILNTQQSVPESHSSSIRRHIHPSVAVNPNVLRRKSFSGGAVRQTSRHDSSPVVTRRAEAPTRGGSHIIVTPPTIHRHSSPQSSRRRRQSFVGKVQGVLQRGRQIAYRGKRPHVDAKKPRASTATNASSATSSPGLSHHRGQQAHLQAKTDSMYTHTVDDIRMNFPWLDVVEHMVVSFYSTPTEFQNKRKQSCSELMVALKYMYSMKFQKNKDATTSSDSVRTPTEFPSKVRPVSEAGITTAFTNATFIPEPFSPTKTGTSTTGSRTMGSIIRQTPFTQVSFDEMPSSLGKLDFSGVRLRLFLESGIMWGSKLDENLKLEDILGEDKELLDFSIDYLLETDSSHSLEHLLDTFNSRRLEYVSTIFAGLLHAPFSLLTYSAPVLHHQTFRDLQESSWIALCDTDYEYADAAASFFLLCCVKEKDSMYSFLKSKAKKNHPLVTRDAITRFEVLWRCRDSVWPRMEQSAPKLFKLDEETGDAIGYSLPSQLLGTPGDILPHAPWKPSSICVHNHDKDEKNEKCYQATKHAPLEHLSDVVLVTRTYPVTGVSVIQMEMDATPAVGNSNDLLELDRELFEQGIINVKEVHKYSTLFPNDLLPLIIIVIRALNPPVSFSCLLTGESDTSIPTITQISNSAEELLWHCMLDNPYYLFTPLLNQFNVLYQFIKDKKRKAKLTMEETAEELLDGVLKPFHTLLSHFRTLPPRAAHLLFNNFIGIVMRHTEQPVVMSDVIIHSVLTLLKMVVPSMKGLSMKELKNQLKKESCYTTILTTARIRGVEKIKLTYPDKSNDEPWDNKDFTVEENMKFLHVIAKDRNIDADIDPLRAFHSYYLTEEKKTNRTVLTSLVIQDHYPAPADGSVPTFAIHESTSNHKAVWDQQLELLHVHKLTEIARVLFAIEMLKVDTSYKGVQQEFAQPNPVFILSELQGLSSFPRKTLSSLPDEVGPAGLQMWHLRMVDTMLRGVWSKFILNLFTEVQDYQPNEDMILFLTVINGSLLLQAEDSCTLRYSMAALLIAAQRFESVFRQNAYQMIVPMLLRVYSLHCRNKMVKDAVKFIWTRFYWMSENTFLLQAIVSVANLLSPEVASIASMMKVNFCPLSIDWEAEEQITIVNSVMELIETLELPYLKLPQDKLDILGACPDSVRKRFKNWNGCSLDQIVPLCVTVASFNPEVLRGMQVLVFLDHVMAHLIREYKKKDQFPAIASSVRSLIKGCESLKRTFKGGGGGALPQKGVPTSSLPDDTVPEGSGGRKVSAYFKQIMFRNRSGTSQSLQNIQVSSKTLMTELHNAPLDEQHSKYTEGFRDRRFQDINQEILKLSRDSLLSIASQLVSQVNKEEEPSPSSRGPLDSVSISHVCSMTEKVLRQASKTSQDHLLFSKGVKAIFTDLLPNVHWDAENTSSFYNLLDRIAKIFKKVHSRELITLTQYAWNSLLGFVNCLRECVSKHPGLITENDQILLKIKSILEVCMTVKIDSASSPTSAKTRMSFIREAEYEFIASLVDLCAEMIVKTREKSAKHRVLLSGLFSGKLDFKIPRPDSVFVWEKLFLPLSVNLGLRGNLSLICEEDVDFIMETISRMVDQIHVIIQFKAQSKIDQIERYFNNMKILLTAFSGSFSLEQWMNVGCSMLTLVSSVKADDKNELHIRFCSLFLEFWDTFLVLCRLPIFSITWHAVSAIENQLTFIEKTHDLSNEPHLLNTLSNCLQKCATLRSSKSLLPVSMSKKELLLMLKVEILPGFCDQHEKAKKMTKLFLGISSDIDGIGQPLEDPQQSKVSWSQSLKRRNSKAPNFPAIEEIGEPEVLSSANPSEGTKNNNEFLEKKSSTSSSQPRPTTLSFKPVEDIQDSSLEKKHKGGHKSATSFGSPSIFKSKPVVSFSDKLNDKVEASPQSKKTVGFGLRKRIQSSPVAEGQKKGYSKQIPSSRRRTPHNERLKQSNLESGHEADEEDASLETPRTSFSYSSTWPSDQIDLSNLTSVPENTNVNLVNDLSLQFSAEIHHYQDQHDHISLSSNESDFRGRDSTSLSSEEDEVASKSKVATSKVDEGGDSDRLKKSSPLLSHTGQDSTVSYHDSPSNIKRKLFQKTRPKNVFVDDEEPDEQTGQSKTSSSTRPNFQSSDNSHVSKSSLLYKTGVNEAASFLGSPKEDEVTWSDDCSV